VGGEEESEVALRRALQTNRELAGRNILLQDRVEQSERERVCVVCMTSPRVQGFYPCNHFCCCGDCAAKCYEREGSCPMCRTASVGLSPRFFVV